MFPAFLKSYIKICRVEQFLAYEDSPSRGLTPMTRITGLNVHSCLMLYPDGDYSGCPGCHPLVSSTRDTARWEALLYPRRHMGHRLHLCRDGEWETPLPWRFGMPSCTVLVI